MKLSVLFTQVVLLFLFSLNTLKSSAQYTDTTLINFTTFSGTCVCNSDYMCYTDYTQNVNSNYTGKRLVEISIKFFFVGCGTGPHTAVLNGDTLGSFNTSYNCYCSNCYIDSIRITNPTDLLSYNLNGNNAFRFVGAQLCADKILIIRKFVSTTPDNAGVYSVDSPYFACSGSQPIKATIANFGNNQIDSVQVHWTYNGVAQTMVHHKTKLDTIGGAGAYLAQISLGSKTLVNGKTDTLVVWTSLPNGVNDTANSDDTLVAYINPSMSGTYTIGGSSPDYGSIQDAINDLYNKGICGPVTLSIRNGGYNEQVLFKAIQGSSATNTITIKSESGDSSQVDIYYTSTSSAANYTMAFDIGASNYILDRLTFAAYGSSWSRVLTFLGNNHNIQIDRCHFSGQAISSTNSHYAVIFRQSSNSPINGLSITNSRIEYGSYGMFFDGNNNLNFNISGNRFEGAYYTIYNQYYGKGLKFNNNYLKSHSSGTGGFGLQLESVDSLTVSGNQIIKINGNGALYLYNSSGTSANSSRIYNNFFSSYSSTGYNSPGVNLYYCNYLQFVNNSIYSSSTNSSRGLLVESGINQEFYNNVIQRDQSGWALEINGVDLAYNNFNHNLYYSDGAKLFKQNGMTINSLPAWYSATGKDSSSRVSDPLFKGQEDLHTNSVDLNGRALKINFVTDDLDGHTRDTINPDLGADEFNIPPIDAGVSYIHRFNADSICVRAVLKNMGSSTLTSANIGWRINGAAQTPYSWSGSLGSGDTISICLGYYKFQRDTFYNILSWSYSPNGTTDTVNSNDTFNFQTFPALNGVYTIGGTSPDFTNFSMAVDALHDYGILDSVLFKVRDGVYTQFLEFDEIEGIDDLDDIVFESESKDSSKVVLQYNTNSSTNYVLSFNSTSGITFRYITIRSTQTSNYSRVIYMYDNVSGITFYHNNIVNNMRTSSDLWSDALFYSDYNNLSNINFEGNRMIGGSSAIYANNIYEFNFNNNLVDSQYYCGLYLDDITGECYLNNNVIQSNSGYSDYYGIYCSDWGGSGELSHNTIIGPNKQENTGMYFNSMYQLNGSDTIRIFNNFISVGGTNNSCNGVSIDWTEATYFVNNSILYYGMDTFNSHALKIYYPDHLILQNNIAMNSMGGMPVSMESPYGTVSDNNCYYSPYGGICEFDGTDYYDFSELRDYGLDSNSISSDPLYAGNTDLHASSRNLDSMGMPIWFVNTDFDGETRNVNFPDIGADEFEVPTLDIMPSAYLSPAVTIKPGTSAIIIAVRNAGIDTVYSFKARAIVNNDTLTVVSVTTTLAPGDTVHVNLGNYTFKRDSVNNIKSWTFDPNNSTDQKKSNDTIRIQNRKTAMSGVYTIGGSSPDFNTFKQAIDAMVSLGIADSVRFRVRSGTYTERIRIPSISGAGARNSIIFESENFDSLAVTLTYNSTQWDSNYVVLLDGADGVTFRKMTVKSTNTNYARVFDFKNGSDYNILTGLKIEGPVFTYSSSEIALVYSDNGNVSDHYNEFTGNTFLNGGHGIMLHGSTMGMYPSYYEMGTIISNNLFLDQRGFPVNLIYQNSPQVLNNTIINNKTSTDVNAGISIIYTYGRFNISGNFIQRIYQGRYAIYGYGFDNSDSSLISNNIIDLNYTSTSHGIYLEYGTGFQIINNTIRMRSNTNSSGSCMYLYYGSNMTVLNNIFENEGMGYNLYIPSSSTLVNSNHNNFRSKGTYPFYYNGSLYTDLPSYSSVSGNDSSSMSVDPEFKSAEDLHIKSPDLNMAALVHPFVTRDFDGDIRDTLTPDIGADEFTPPPIDAGISQILAPNIPFKSDTQYVKVVLKNYGSVNLASAVIEWNFNGVSKTAYNWSGSLNLGDTAHVILDRVYFNPDSAYSLIAWSRLPNSQNDTINSNDTAKAFNQYPALSGIYTIGGASPDFATFTEAVSAMRRGGIIDSVVFNVRNGTYFEQIRLNKILGANRKNAIVFQSENGDSSQVVLNYTGQSWNQNYTVQLDSATGVTFRNMTISGGNTSYGIVLSVYGNCKWIDISNNLISGSGRLTQSTDHSGIYIRSYNIFNDSIDVRNNTILNTSVGIYSYGYISNSVYSRRIHLTGNSINAYYTGIFSYYTDSSRIENNNIELLNPTYSQYGMYLYYSRYMNLNSNRIHQPYGYYGLYLYNCDANSTRKGIVTNNMIYSGSNNAVIGAYFEYCDHLEIFNNNIYVPSTSSSSEGVYFYYGGSNRFVANVVQTGNGIPLYLLSSSSLNENNYNCYFYTGSNIAYWSGTNYTTLSGFQSGSGREAQSVNADPMFVSTSDLHVRGVDLNEHGVLSNIVKYDFDGEPRDSVKPDIGADEFRIPGPDDAGISAYITPVAPFASGSQTVKVLITNYGSDTLKSATVNWAMNGTSQTAVNWSGNIPSGRTDTVTLGSFSFAPAVKYSILAWPTQPNGKADTLNYNDTLFKTDIYTALAGEYTIGGTLPDFNTFNEAVSALHLGGVLDSVTFKVRNGTYTEQVKLMTYPGSQSNRPVTFTSESGDSSKVTLTYSSGSGNNHVFWINGADYITISRITIQPTYYYYGNAVVINNGSQNCNLMNNMIRHTNPGYYSTNGVLSSSDIDNNLTISGNTIIGFQYGVQLYGNSGSSSNYESGLNITGNNLSNLRYVGIYLAYQKSFNVVSNTITAGTEGDIGILTTQTADAFTIQGNKIVNGKYSYNLQIQNHAGTSSNKGRIFNNFLSNYYTYGYNLRMENCNYVDIDYNSMNFHTVAYYPMIYFSSNSNYNMRNNIIAHNANGVTMQVYGNLPGVSNYNNWYTGGSVLIDQGGISRANLSAWKAGTSKDANSLSVNPVFFTNEDLHTTLITLDSAGTTISGITSDIDGDTRNSSRPDIGADEFNSLPDNVGVTGILNNSGCDLDSQIVQVTVFNFGSNRQTGFKVKYSVNGTFVDSLTVADSINSGQSKSYSFPVKYHFGSYTSYLIKAWTDLSNETYRLNDSSSKSITNYQTVSSVGSMLPSDSTENISFPVTLSWTPSSGATLYDVYIWADSISSRPGSPYLSNISQISTQITTGLGYGIMYKWQVVAKNPTCSYDGPVQRFRMRYLPDLIVNSVSAPVSAFSGNSVNVSWVVKNTGTGSTGSTSWWDLVYMSSDQTFDGSDINLGGAGNTASLGANQSYSNNVNVTIPNGYNGKYYFIIRTDAYNSVIESNDGNNLKSDSAGTNITLTPPPDLRVASVQAPSTVFSGSEINVRFTIKNHGTGETRPDAWYDAVYLSKDSVFNSNAVFKRSIYHNGNLDVDSTYTVNTTIGIPVTSSGYHYVYIVTDVNNQIYEHASENNNRGGSDTIDVLLTPPPDLIVRNIVVPDTSSGRKLTNVSYQVINQGGSRTLNGWYDAIYISTSPVFNPASSEFLYNGYHANLQSGDTLFISRNVTIPDGYNGNYYIWVYTDAYNYVFEGTEDTNNVSRASIVIVRPDLRISNLSVPASDSSGTWIPVSWRVTNHGPGDDPSKARKDKIFLSSYSKYHKDSVLSLDSITYTVSLNKGAYTDKSTMVKLPNGIFGSKFIHVFTDINDVIVEQTDTNNAAGSAIEIILSPYPDLTLTSLTVPDSSEAGSTSKLIYSVKNNGLIGAAPQWKDRLYLSKDSVFDISRAVLLHTFTKNNILDTTESYTDSVVALIPGSVAAGNYYFYAFTDAEDKLYEYLYESNNVRRSKKIYVDGYPPVDLAVDSVSAPDSAYSGSPFSFSWRVKNIGEATTLADYWTDRAYLSLDSVLDASDVFLGESQINDDLKKDSTYTVNRSFNVPNGTNGNYYLIIWSDIQNSNNDFDTTNNKGLLRNSAGIARKILIKLSASPDLKFTSWNIPSTGTTGQPIKIVWQVKNEGNGPTLTRNWVDRIYLSTDFNIDGSDFVLGSRTHNGILSVSDSYKDSAELTVPSHLSGNLIVIIKTDESNLIYEHNAENNNTVASAITLSNAPPANLIVSSVSAPTSAVSGSNVTVDYTVKNIGSNPASGWMRDNIYLSSDTIWDATDVLFGSLNYNIGLLPGNSVNKSVSGSVSGVSNGEYYFVVFTDIMNNIFESADTNNTGYSNSISISIPELPMNTLKADTLYNYANMYYRLVIPDSLDGESVLITLKGDSVNGNNELYVRYGDVPTRANFDYAYDAPFEGNQELLIPEVHTGDYYLLIYGSTTAGPRQHVTLFARKLNFEIRKISPVEVGNNGQFTLKIEGSKFTESTIFSLTIDSAFGGSATVDTTGIMYEAMFGSGGDEAGTFSIQDPTVVYATFKFDNTVKGLYDVVATKETEQTSLSKGLKVTTTESAGIDLNVTRPSNSRTSVVNSFKIDYTNVGNVDLVNGELLILSNGGAPISFTPAGLIENRTSLTIPLEEDTGPSGILRPRGTGSVIIYTNSTSALGFSILLPN